MNKLFVVVIIVAGILMPATYVVYKSYSKTLPYKRQIVSHKDFTLQSKDNFIIPELSSTKDLEQFNIIEPAKSKPFPTNSWIKPVAVNGCESNIFPYPYFLKTHNGNITFGLMESNYSANTAFNILRNDIQISTENKLKGCYLKDYDELGAWYKIEYENDKYIDFYLQKGAPYIHFDTNINQLKISAEKVEQEKNNLLKVQSKGIYNEASIDKNYNIKFNNDIKLEGNTIIANNDNLKFNAYYYFNDQIKNEFYETLTFEPQNIKTDLKMSENNTFTQAFFTEQKDKQFYLVLLPHHYIDSQIKTYPEAQLVNYENAHSIRGEYKLIKANKIELVSNALIPQVFPELNLTQQQKDTIKNYMEKDMDELGTPEQLFAAGVYWKGKKLQKFANLMYLNNLVGDNVKKDAINYELRKEVENFFNYTGEEDKKYFYYDNTFKGIVHSQPEFGSDMYTDHNLQLSYHVYTFATLAKYNKDFIEKYKTPVELVIRSVASFDPNDKYFPYLRNLDIYEGHSYVSGIGYFADGNNQESSSEAMNFWYGAYMWYTVTNQPELANIYLAAYNLEAKTTNIYYFNTKPESKVFNEKYNHQIASIVWEGKYDFATWFDGHPNAVHGIQLIPITLGSVYLKHDNFYEKHIQTWTQKVTDKFEHWIDIKAVYMAVNKDSNIEEIYNKLPEVIDSGNSRAWMFFMKEYYKQYNN